MYKLFVINFFLFVAVIGQPQKRFDLTIIGKMIYEDGIGRIPIGWIDTLKNDLKINFQLSEKTSNKDLSCISNWLRKQIISIDDNSKSDVLIYFDLLWHKFRTDILRLPNSKIKIAYSMLESTSIPSTWVEILNSKFDMLVVPDSFLVKVYKNSGVNIPIFVLPVGMYLADLTKYPIKQINKQNFVYGMSAEFIERKNYSLLIKAFSNAFGNNRKVMLKIHGRGYNQIYFDNIIRQINDLNLRNIHIINKRLSDKQYNDFLSKLDCYIFLSKGEGFSQTPREAMALGIPCIITSNTAHITLCKSNLVKPLISNKLVLAFYDIFDKFCGYYFDTSVDDVEKALITVYENIELYKKKAEQYRKYALKYDYQNLKPYMLNLVKPKKVYIGKSNKLEKDYIITNSKNLYDKYVEITKKNKHIL